MYAGKTLFAQIMEFVPWTSFTRIVHRYCGNAGVRTLSCAEQFRAMAFAQLTWRESLRDVEACLSANVRISDHLGHRFQLIPDGVSEQAGQRFKLMPDGISA